MLSNRRKDVVAAFLLAITAVPVYILVAGGPLNLTALVLVWALPHVVLAVPIYFLLRRFDAVNFVTCLVAGFLVAALPYLVLTLVAPTIQTKAALLLSASFGFFGAISGFVFWGTLKVAGRLYFPQSNITNEENTVATLRPVRSTGFWGGNGVLITAVLASMLAYFSPSIMKDRSCYNMYRDSEEIPRPRVYVDVDIPDAEWDLLPNSLHDLSDKHGLEYRATVADRSRGQWRTELCNNSGLNVAIGEISPDFYVPRGLPDHARFRVAVYDRSGEAGWESTAAQLFRMLDGNWTGKVFFSDGRGNEVPIPEQLVPYLTDE